VSGAATHRPRIQAVLRQEERVTPLELFFDLVFVLAITQCTALMADNPSWEGIARGILILALMWWAWTGYAWLTSVVQPEEGAVRLVIFAAMAGLLVVSLCVPGAFGDEATLFACAYTIVRFAQIGLFVIASRDYPELRHSVVGLAGGTALGCGLLIIGSFFEPEARFAIWSVALVLDVLEPYLFGAEGWKLQPSHFAERHGLILIIALGESIVAIGAGASVAVDGGVVVAATLGIVIAAAFWWLYFDVVALVAERRLSEAEVGREQNEMARDSYSYLHFGMVAGIILVALGLKQTIGHVDTALKLEVAVATLGGTALYLLSHVAFRWRNVHTLNSRRLLCALVMLALIPLATEISALASVTIIAVLLIALIVYEVIRFAEFRERIRHQLNRGDPTTDRA
jgi:low temperature requirement protein LtrA